jgi:hypothetical protein
MAKVEEDTHRILKVLMNVVNQATGTRRDWESGICYNEFVSSYEDAFELLEELGLAEPISWSETKLLFEKLKCYEPAEQQTLREVDDG